MSALEISDLSFCEVTEKDIEVQGGLVIAGSFTNEDFQSLITRFVPINLGEYNSEPVYSNPDFVIERLQNQTTGASGYLVSSKDGKSKSGTIVGPNSIRSFATYVSRST